MNKSNDWQQNPQDMGGPTFHPALTSIGRSDNIEDVSSYARKPLRTFNSFKSLAEILGTANNNEALTADNKTDLVG